jgi:hypothetical protein
MRSWLRLPSLVLCFLLISSFPACKRKLRTQLHELDQINRSSNLPMVEPVKRDLAQIRERGSLTVLAPYNSTTYFLYRGEPPTKSISLIVAEI